MIRIEVVKVLHSSSCIISKQSQLAVRQPGNWVRLSLGYWPPTLFSEMQMLQGVICYKGAQDVIHRVLKSNRLAL